MYITTILKEPKINIKQRFITPHTIGMIRWVNIPSTWKWEQRCSEIEDKYDLSYAKLFSIKNIILSVLILFSIIGPLLITLKIVNPLFLLAFIFSTIITLILLSERSYLYINKFSDGEISSLYLYYNIYIFTGFQIFMVGFLMFFTWVSLSEYIPSAYSLEFRLFFIVISLMFIIGSSALIYYFNISYPIWVWGKFRILNINGTIPRQYVDLFLANLLLEAERNQVNEAGKRLALEAGLLESSLNDIFSIETLPNNFWENLLLSFPSVIALVSSLANVILGSSQTNLLHEFLKRF